MSTRGRPRLSVEEFCRHRCHLQELLKEVPLEAPDIIKAAASNSVEVVKDWITKGGDVNARDAEGFTALHYAASRDHSDIVRTLLQHRADLRGDVNPTPLILGIIHDSSLAVDALLTSGEDPNFTIGTDSALAIAAFFGALKCVQVLLKYNADVNELNPNCSTVDFLVCCYLRLEFQKFMKNEDTLLAMLKALVATDVVKLDQRQGVGQTVLHVAACAGSFEAVKCLVEAGASPVIVDERGATPADLAQEYPLVQDYLLSCQGPVRVEEMKMAAEVGGDVITTSIQAAACLVDIGCGATLSVTRSNPSSMNPSCPQEIDLPAGDSSSKDTVAASSLSYSHRQSSRLTLDPGALERKTFLKLHEFHSPPVVSVSKKEVIKPLKKKATSKRENKALRREEKRKHKDTVTAMRDLLPVGDSRDVLALAGSRWLYQGREPHLSTNTSQLISPFTAVSTNHPVTLKRPGRLIIPRAARPGVSGLTESSVDSHPYHIAVQQMSLRDDGLGLTAWRTVNDEDVQPAEGSVTVILRKLSLFSTFVVIAVRNRKDPLKSTLKHRTQRELDFCVVGRQYYSKQMMPIVVCFTNGSTARAVCNRLARDGTDERLVVWGPSQAVRVSVDEDITMKLSMLQENWTVAPEEQRLQRDILRSSRTIHSVAFVLTSPSAYPCEASGLCSVQVSGVQEPLRLPFCTPTTREAVIRDISLGDAEKSRQLGHALAISRKVQLPHEYAHDAKNQTGAEDDADVLVESRNSQPPLVPDPCIASATEPKSSGLCNDKSGDESNKLDVLIVTATDTEFEGVTAVLRKASGQDLEARHLYYSEGVMPCKIGSWKPGDERPPIMVGVTQQTQAGAVATGNMVIALKDALKSQQVTKKGLVAMVGMCAGDEHKVELGDVLVPWEIAVERGKMRGDGTFDTDATYSALPLPLRTAVQTALPKLQADAKKDNWLEYLPDELRKIPSPRYLVDVTLFELNKRSHKDGGVVDIGTLYTDLIDHYKWPRKVICKSIIIEVLDNLVTAGYADDIGEIGVDFKINDKGKEQVRIQIARNDSFPRVDSDTPKIKHDSVIMGHVVNTAMTKKAWDEERKRAGKRTAIGYEMEGYTFLEQLTTWCQSTRVLFIKSVADFGTEEYKMKNKYYQVYATAVAAAFLFHFLEVVRPSDWQT